MANCMEVILLSPRPYQQANDDVPSLDSISLGLVRRSLIHAVNSTTCVLGLANVYAPSRSGKHFYCKDLAEFVLQFCSSEDRWTGLE
jgi:hypothetical protein